MNGVLLWHIVCVTSLSSLYLHVGKLNEQLCHVFMTKIFICTDDLIWVIFDYEMTCFKPMSSYQQRAHMDKEKKQREVNMEYRILYMLKYKTYAS